MYDNLIKKLGGNLETLTTQYSKMISQNNYNESLNVLKNIDMIVKQLKELGFEIMTSKYKTTDEKSGELTNELAIWKQNGFGQIKDHEVYRIDNSGSIKCNTIYGSVSGCNNISEQNGWYNVLKFFIETNQSQLIQLDYTSKEKEVLHRGTGKTTALTRLSSELNIPILSLKTQAFVYQDKSDELNISRPVVISDRSKMLPQYTNKKIFLVDEFELPFEIDKDKYILIGFERKLTQ